jgi:hypothetical protein
MAFSQVFAAELFLVVVEGLHCGTPLPADRWIIPAFMT